MYIITCWILLLDQKCSFLEINIKIFKTTKSCLMHNMAFGKKQSCVSQLFLAIQDLAKTIDVREQCLKWRTITAVFTILLCNVCT